MKKITFLVAALFATMMANATSVTLTMADIAATSGEKDGVSFTTDKKNGSSAPSYNGTSKDLRLYAKNTITITYTENIKSISFAISKKGQYRLASLTADNGTCTVKGTPDFTAVWSGDSKTVTITVGDKADYGTDGNTKAGQLCFDSFTVSTEDLPTAIREVEVMTDVYARDGRIYAEEGARIFTVTGLDVTRQNGQLNGIYVVKAGNKVAKVVVK